MIDLKAVKVRGEIGRHLTNASGLLVPLVAYFRDWHEGGRVQAPALVWVLQKMDQYSDAIFLLGLIAFLLERFLSGRGKRLVWEGIQSQLDTLRKIAFPDHQNDFQENHRVTLFRWTRWCFKVAPFSDWRFYCFPWKRGRLPNSGWLVPVQRAGSLGKESSCVFLAPATNSQRAEGMAGLAWAKDSMQVQLNLPSVTQASGQNASKYMTRTKTSEEMLKRYITGKKPLPRALIGLPVRDVSGHLWGALVIDSREPDAIDEARVREAFDAISGTLAVLLEDAQ